LFPRKEAKKAAEKAYGKAIVAALISEADLLAKTKAYAALWVPRLAQKPADKQYIPLLASWLNGRRWEDETEARVGPAAALSAISTEDFTDAQWQSYLQVFNAVGQWPDYLGAKPRTAGCRVPSHLIGGPEGSLRTTVAAPLRGPEGL
jgi:hypothetical protein